MRLLPLLLFASLGLTLVLAQPAPAFPPLASQSGPHEWCLLEDMHFTHGLTLSGPFSKDKFEYICSCDDWSALGSGAGSPALMIDLWDDFSYAQVWFNGRPVSTLPNGHLHGKGPLTSAPIASAENHWQVGDNLIQILVSCDRDECEYQYTIRCNKPPEEGGSVIGDPQFMGLRGQDFQVHGVAGEVYNIVSDPDLQYNSRFVFLEKGECPVVEGVRQRNCYSHPGSYLGELGLKTRAGDRMLIVSGPAKEGFAEVAINGKALSVGDSVQLAENLGSISRNTTHLLTVSVGQWSFEFENSDLFINQQVSVLDARSLRSHGLLGQTWKDVTYNNAIKHIQGQVDDYAIRDGDLFGDSFVFNAFN